MSVELSRMLVTAIKLAMGAPDRDGWWWCGRPISGHHYRLRYEVQCVVERDDHVGMSLPIQAIPACRGRSLGGLTDTPHLDTESFTRRIPRLIRGSLGHRVARLFIDDLLGGSWTARRRFDYRCLSRSRSGNDAVRAPFPCP